MPKCTDGTMELGRVGRRVVEANFEGGDLSSDGGLLLLRRADERIGLSRAAAAVLSDPRDPTRITHSLRDLLAQRIYGLCCGYEDLNDHDALRDDLLMQTAVGRVDALASSPTLSRLETRATRAQAVALHGVLIDQFIASHKAAPTELVLDIDASDVALHGNQELSQFHAYYDSHCYLPLYVFCGQAMLACVLRRSRIDGAKNAAAVIKLLVHRLRRAWPEVRIIVRGDSGFCRQRFAANGDTEGRGQTPSPVDPCDSRPCGARCAQADTGADLRGRLPARLVWIPTEADRASSGGSRRQGHRRAQTVRHRS